MGVLTYSAAAVSGVSRLYNNAHWVSDIIFGAGMGILAGTKTVTYARTHPNNWLDRTLLHATVAPGPNHALRIGFSFDSR